MCLQPEYVPLVTCLQADPFVESDMTPLSKLITVAVHPGNICFAVPMYIRLTPGIMSISFSTSDATGNGLCAWYQTVLFHIETIHSFHVWVFRHRCTGENNPGAYHP